MTTLEYSSKNPKRSFFSIYKPTQGKYVRWGTVAGCAVVILTGAAWMGLEVFGNNGIEVRAIAVCVWVAILAVVTFWLVNYPPLAEFMIMTESEMRKVTWPSRREVITSTKVVILLTVVLGSLLWFVDVGFKTLFEWMGILK